jgi:hypothetical protein
MGDLPIPRGGNMHERLQALTDDELRAVVGGEDIIDEIKRMIFHEHDSKLNLTKRYGDSIVR